MKTKREFETYFRQAIEGSINASDKPALRQAWNDTINLEIKHGNLPARAGEWSHPRRFYTSIEKPPARARKTEIEFEVQAYYGGAWECVTTETDRKQVFDRLKEYRANEPGTIFRYIRKRVKIQQPAN